MQTSLQLANKIANFELQRSLLVKFTSLLANFFAISKEAIKILTAKKFASEVC